MNELENISSCEISQPYEGKMSLENYLLPIFFVITSLTGIIGNSTVIYIILFKPGMRTVPNLLIVNLSFGDMVFIFGHLSFSLPSYLLKSFYGGSSVCRMIILVKMTTLGVSIFTLTFMAIDRFRAITRPLHQQALSRLSVITILTVIWIFSTVISLPFTIMTFVQIMTFKSNGTCWIMSFCSSENKYFVETTWMRFCVYFVAPFLIICFCYVRISTTLCKSQSSPLVMNNNYYILRRQMDGRRKLAIVVLALVVMFVVCRLPYESHSIYLLLQKESIQEWVSVSTVMLYIYSFINPLILAILSPIFRRFMVGMWCWCWQSEDNSDHNITIPINSTQWGMHDRINRNPSPVKLDK